MIVNIPPWADLQTISLQLYFKAWDEATSVVTDFRAVYDDEGWEEGWREYLDAAQTDLQGTYTLIQQSQEIGIKALIAQVSPFLLLKRHETRPIAPNAMEYDFSDFPTIDAGELLRVHDTFCDRRLSEAFAVEFDKLRRGRNKIAHLGLFNQKLDPHELLSLLLLQYEELYPNRHWLPDRLDFASKGRFSEMDFEGHWHVEAHVLQALWEVVPDLSPEQFKIVFGHAPEDERFICLDCAYALERHTEGNEPYPADIPTAYRIRTDTVQCAMCLKEHQVKDGVCANPDCEGRTLAAHVEHGDECLTCGWTPEDVQRNAT